MLWTLMVQTTSYVALTHILAPRRYAFRWARPIAGRVLKFGIPLLANGLLIYLYWKSKQ